MRCFVLLKLLTETKLLAELLVNYYCVNVFVANKVLSLSLPLSGVELWTLISQSFSGYTDYNSYINENEFIHTGS